ACRKQSLHHVPTDEMRAAKNQYSHASPPTGVHNMLKLHNTLYGLAGAKPGWSGYKGFASELACRDEMAHPMLRNLRWENPSRLTPCFPPTLVYPMRHNEAQTPYVP